MQKAEDSLTQELVDADEDVVWEIGVSGMHLLYFGHQL
jgi:hypothetical protein